MLSYHNSEEVKRQHVEMAKRHYEQDMLVAGTYGKENGRFEGCSVGCFAHEIAPTRADYHAVVAEAAGWPEWLVQLSDTLFEGLPGGERERFHVVVREAVPVGVDLEPVRHRLAVRRMDRLIASMSESAYAGRDEVIGVLETIKAGHELEGGDFDWSAAGSAAQAAADSARSAATASWSAAWSASKGAAWGAAWSTAESAESAGSVAGRAAERAYQSERDDLLGLLREIGP